MHPILFTIGDFPLHTYGVLGSVAFLLVAGIGLVRGRAIGLVPERVADLVFITAITSLIGSRVLFVLQNPEVAVDAWAWVDIRSGGLVFYGALLTGLPVASLVVRWFGFPFFATWDIFATAMPLGHALTRVGCFAAGCCHGLPTNLPWAVTFTEPGAPAPLHIPLHPTQLYEAAWLLLVGIVVNLRYSRRRFEGEITALYLLLYALGRGVIEAFRGDATRGYFLPEVFGTWLSYSQGVSVLIALVAVGFAWAGRRRAQQGEGSPG